MMFVSALNKLKFLFEVMTLSKELMLYSQSFCYIERIVGYLHPSYQKKMCIIITNCPFQLQKTYLLCASNILMHGEKTN